MGGIKRFILWDYPRASWQYDVIVGLILLFIFATPRDWFRDQPKPSSVVLLPAQPGSAGWVFWIEPDILTAVPEADRPETAANLIRRKVGHKPAAVRLEPISDAEHEIRGFVAFASQ